MRKYVMGIDFGTLSVRAAVVDALSGAVCGTAVCSYEHGVMDSTLPDGTPLLRGSALEHPSDYINAMKEVVARSLERAGCKPEDISGVGVDFTSCTLLALDAAAMPMCLHEKYASDENAYVKLWKSHSAEAEAEHIRRVAESRGERFLDCYGGDVSSEAMLPKILQTLNNSPELYASTDRFVEAGDWIVRLLIGEYAPSPCFAGIKGFWSSEEGFPSNDFFRAVDERLDGLVGGKISSNVVSPSSRVGYVSREGAQLFGLAEGTAVAVPLIDAHAGAPAVGGVGAGKLMMILGTSGSYIVSSEQKALIKGAVLAENAIFDGLCTYEQGQCCFGDSFDWFVKSLVSSEYEKNAAEAGLGIHQYLSGMAAELAVGESGLLALDWFNGNRSVLADTRLSGLIVGLSIATRPEHIWRALMEAQAYGAKMIIDNYEKNGIAIDTVIASGGISLKDSLLMQIFADVLDREIRVSGATEACAVGSAIYGAVACGIYGDIYSASEHMSAPIAKIYTPIPENVRAYKPLFEEYVRLHDYFGRGGNDVMKSLLKK